MENLLKRIKNYKKKSAIDNKKVYYVEVHAIDVAYYEMCKKFFGDYTESNRLQSGTGDMVRNIANMRKFPIIRVAVYYSDGEFKELITDTPITGLKEVVEFNPNNGKNIILPMIIGKTEPFFFVYSEANNIYEYGCNHLKVQLLHRMSDEEIELYLREHNNEELYRLELQTKKAKAISDYFDVLLSFADKDSSINDIYRRNREKIIRKDRKRQQM